MVAELTTTSYAILGLISLRPSSAYDLAQQMRRSLRLWPRAERGLYNEPKKLVEHGLVKAKVERTGQRSRTVYTITAAGRRRLAAWLSEPSAPPELESEAILRTLFATHGSKDDLLAAIRSVGDYARSSWAEGAQSRRAYIAGDGPFPERLHIIGLLVQFGIEYLTMLERWSAWAEAEVEGWDSVTDPAVFPGAVDVLRRTLAPTPRAADGTSR